MSFKPPGKDLLGIPTNENHLVIEWCGPGRILFSFTRRGDALSCHFASDKRGLRHIKAAINDFASYVRYNMPWCKMLLAVVERPSVGRLIKKCGFKFVVETDRAAAYSRRLWDL